MKPHLVFHPKTIRTWLRRGLAALLLLAWIQPVHAASCTFNTTGTLVNFDFYIAGSSEKLAEALLNFTCVPTLPAVTVSYTVGVDAGLANSYNPRRLYLNGDSGSGSSLTYNLYIDNGRNQILGNGTAGAPATTPSTLCTGVCVHRIFGRIFGGQNPVPGPYIDTVNVTLNF